MSTRKNKNNKNGFVLIMSGVGVCVLLLVGAYLFVYTNLLSGEYNLLDFTDENASSSINKMLPPAPPQLDKVAYDLKMVQLANYPAPKMATSTATSSATTRR